MGMIYADIELVNAVDLDNSRRYLIGEDEVKRIRLDMLVDSGAYMLARQVLM